MTGIETFNITEGVLYPPRTLQQLSTLVWIHEPDLALTLFGTEIINAFIEEVEMLMFPDLLRQQRIPRLHVCHFLVGCEATHHYLAVQVKSSRAEDTMFVVYRSIPPDLFRKAARIVNMRMCMETTKQTNSQKVEKQ